MMREMYGDSSDGDDILGDLLAGDDNSGGFEYSEIMGGDDALGELIGDGSDGDDSSNDAVIGAAVRRRRNRNAKKNALAGALMRRRVQDGAVLRSVPPRNSREYALGLGSTSVTGNSSANINVQPQVIFRPERLVVPSNIAPDFLITDIKVGKNSQLVSTGALPAVMFTEQAFGVRLKMDTAQISMFVTISVTNQNPQARNFQGGLVGPAVE
jgi:hypothetical protein